jgi:hypothetical protein
MVLDAIAFALSEALIVRSYGEPVTLFPCGITRISTDVGTTPIGRVSFHPGYAEISFPGDQDDAVTLYVYVDGTSAALLTLKGAVKVVVPLDARRHHKVVTGRSLNGEAVSISAACN